VSNIENEKPLLHHSQRSIYISHCNPTTIVTSLEENTSYIGIVVEGTPSRQKSGVIKIIKLESIILLENT
jgi:hypothetical protein